MPSRAGEDPMPGHPRRRNAVHCIDAVILHTVPDDVKPDRRGARRAESEARLIAAASARFVERGYAATTLADVAEQAGLAARTVYVRFATKAELLRRCIGA